jgi:hypothetical protein
MFLSKRSLGFVLGWVVSVWIHFFKGLELKMTKSLCASLSAMRIFVCICASLTEICRKIF